MNEESLRMIDVETEDTNNESKEKMFHSLPDVANATEGKIKQERVWEQEENFECLPSWNIEPPIEIRRGEK